MSTRSVRQPLASRTNTSKPTKAGPTKAAVKKVAVPGRTNTLSGVSKKRKAESSSDASIASKRPSKSASTTTVTAGRNVKKTTSTSTALKKTTVRKNAPSRLSSDYKGRLEDLTKVHDKLQHKHDENKAKLEDTTTLNVTLTEQNVALVAEVETLQQKCNDVTTAYDNTLESLSSTTTALEESKSKVEELSSSLSTEKEISESLQDSVSRKDDEISKLTNSKAELTAKLENTAANLIEARNIIKDRDATIKSLCETLDQCRGDLKDAIAKTFADDLLRRKLHNTIQDLKGNIRVFCRVRPSSDPCCVDVDMSDREPKLLSINTSSESVSGAKKSKKQKFQFDRVFGPKSSQESVFKEIAHLVQSSLDGYSICIFAYGQTGSGKTYTMEGGSADEQRGMIPRAVDLIFTKATEMSKMGWAYTFEASYVEIYNESIRDLLNDPVKDAAIKHEVRGDGEVSNMTVVKVTSAKTINELLEQASSNRSIASTKMNANSSRSHSVFRLQVSGVNEIGNETCKAMLNLVDLAGSERVEKSGATGERLAEANAINKSLSTLGTVISSLASKEKHVPYRNSKLTHLLQASLGGDAKCLMLANVSPESDSAAETTCSLRFASRVNSCVIGTASAKNGN